MKSPRVAKLFMAICLLPGALTFYALWLLPVQGEVNRNGRAMRGFANLWAAGRAVLSDNVAVLFDQPAYAGWVRHLFGQRMVEQVWAYPPSGLLIATPAAVLPLWPGYLLWTFGTLVALRASLRLCGLPAMAALAVVCSPAAFENVLSGQNGALSGALLIGGLYLSARRPVVSGLMLGLLTVKPQLGILVPICLIAARHSRTVMWAVGTTIVLVASSTAAFGLDSWPRFLTETEIILSGLLAAPWTGAPAQLNFTSPFMASRALGCAVWIAWTLQGIVSLCCACLAWRVWRQVEDPLARVCVTIPLCMLSTPYAHDYDLVSTAAVVVVVARTALARGWLRGERASLALAWAWPGMALLAPTMAPSLKPLSGLVSCLSLSALAWCAHRRAMMHSSTVPGSVLVPITLPRIRMEGIALEEDPGAARSNVPETNP
jgi:hypothetical protein